jgi:hypothetical protein
MLYNLEEDLYDSRIHNAFQANVLKKFESGKFSKIFYNKQACKMNLPD